MKKIFMLIILFASFSTELFAVDCGIGFMERLNKNDTMTRVQKEYETEKKCFNKKIVVSGRVTNVDSSYIEFTDNSGIRYRAWLLHDEACGLLHKIDKSDKITMEGTIVGLWATIKRVRLYDSICVK